MTPKGTQGGVEFSSRKREDAIGVDEDSRKIPSALMHSLRRVSKLSPVLSPLNTLAELNAQGRRLADTTFLREPPRYRVGGVTLNRLGLQIWRTIGQNILYHSRRTHAAQAIQPRLDTLERQGILVLPNFLPSEQFQAITAEVDRLSRDGDCRPIRTEVGDNLVSSRTQVSHRPDKYPAFEKFFQKNETIRQLVAADMRRQITLEPLVYIETLHKPDSEKPYRDSGDNVLHADRHFPTMKVFFYLHEVDIGSAPYVYCPGSHRLSLSRLQYEYEASIIQAGLATGRPSDVPSDQVDRGVVLPSKELLDRMGLVETPICGKANTLILTNNIGFHRRGNFTTGSRRTVASMDFRYLDSRGRILFPVLKRLPF